MGQTLLCASIRIRWIVRNIPVRQDKLLFDMLEKTFYMNFQYCCLRNSRVTMFSYISNTSLVKSLQNTGVDPETNNPKKAFPGILQEKRWDSDVFQWLYKFWMTTLRWLRHFIQIPHGIEQGKYVIKMHDLRYNLVIYFFR